VPALFTGILYDDRALDEAESFAAELDVDALLQARPALVQHGLAASVGNRSMQELALRVLEIAEGGLARRASRNAQGEDERVHLAPLTSLVQLGKTPADALIAGLDAESRPSVAEIIRRTHL
jgi:glutamate--cysteine ligase